MIDLKYELPLTFLCLALASYAKYILSHSSLIYQLTATPNPLTNSIVPLIVRLIYR